MAYDTSAYTKRAFESGQSIPGLLGPNQSSIYQGGSRNLFDLINNPGQTDARLMNQQIAGIGMDTQQRQASTAAQFGRQGMGNSALALAFKNAIGASGMNAAGRARAEEARRREGLRREDTQLMSQFIQEPWMRRYEFDQGITEAEKARRQQQKDRTAQMIGTFIGAAGGMVGGGK